MVTEPAEEQALFDWVERATGGLVTDHRRTAGGNRMWSWLVDVTRPDGAVELLFLRYSPPRPAGVEPYTLEREIAVYRAIADVPIRAPRLIAAAPDLPAMLTTRAGGVAEFRRLSDNNEKRRIADEFMLDLAALHATDRSELGLPGGVVSASIGDHVRAELNTWRAMYLETGRSDGLIELALRWLENSIPDVQGEHPVLVHGDAGPGNFMFEAGHLSAIIDWELAHVGDPMEDLAWFSMRCVMEPVPDFAAALTAYETAAGRPVDRDRIRYHRVFVSTRVVIIRHRNVTGEAAAAIVSRALNQRLLVQALAEANGIALSPTPIAEPAATPRTALFEGLLHDLRTMVSARVNDSYVASTGKAAAKVVKYLAAADRFGTAPEQAEIVALTRLLATPPTDEAEGRLRVAEGVADGGIALPEALQFFAGRAAWNAALAAGASGGISARTYPPLEEPE